MESSPKNGGLQIAHLEQIRHDQVEIHVDPELPRRSNQVQYKTFATRRRVLLGVMSVLVLPIFACEGVVVFSKLRRDPLTSTVVAIAGIMKLGMIYQVLSEKVRKLQKYASLKAFAILNILSSIAFPALVVLSIFKVTQIRGKCIGPGSIYCTLTYIILGCCATISLFAPLVAAITIRNWRWYKRSGFKPMPQLYVLENDRI